MCPIRATVGSEPMCMNRSLALLILIPLAGACSGDDNPGDNPLAGIDGAVITA